MKFIDKLENAHSNIDSLLNADFMRNFLKENTGIGSQLTFGKQGRGFATNNIIDALIDSQLSDEKSIEDLLNLSIGGQFGKNRNLLAEVFGGKGFGGLNITGKF